MAKGFIFDVDWTILDSMEIWMDAAKLYLKDLGIEAEENLGDIMFSLTMAEGAEYIRKTYKVNLSDKEICDGINQKVFGFYKEEAPLKGKSIEILEYAQKNNIPMVVATSTDRPMIEAAFERLNLGKYFKKIYTTTEIGSGKDKPEIFMRAMETLGTKPDETWLLEDGAYSMDTAKKMGIHTVGIYDKYSDKDQDMVKSLADVYITSWDEYEKVIKAVK